MRHWRHQLPLQCERQRKRQRGAGVPPRWIRTSASPSGALPEVTATEKGDTDENYSIRCMRDRSHSAVERKLCVERGAHPRGEDCKMRGAFERTVTQFI